MRYVLTLALLSLAACQTPTPISRPGFTLPPVDAVIARPEPKPPIRRGDNLGSTVLRLDGALNRANTTINQGRSNYEGVRRQVSEQ